MSPNLVISLLSRPDMLDVPAVLLLGGPYVILNGDRLEIPDGSKETACLHRTRRRAS